MKGFFKDFKIVCCKFINTIYNLFISILGMIMILGTFMLCKKEKRKEFVDKWFDILNK